MSARQEIHLNPDEFVLTEGSWDANTPWKFVVSGNKPNPRLCTAAFCVVSHEGKLLLVQNKTRSWELPGGHIDEGESIEAALIRETLEESGAVIESLTIFGYKVVLPKSPIPYRDKPGQSYPFPISYVPYYYAEATDILATTLAPDVISARLVRLHEAKTLFAKGHNHDKIVEYLVNSGSINLKS